MKNINTESTKIDQASKAAIEKADYYAEVAKTATKKTHPIQTLYLPRSSKLLSVNSRAFCLLFSDFY
jgi:hypothetical protein